MDVTHILLGRPWLYDLDVTNHGRENTYVFKYKHYLDTCQALRKSQQAQA